MKKTQIGVLILTLLVGSMLVSFATSSSLPFEASTLEKNAMLGTACVEESFAEWRESNGQPYLYIHALDYYDLGLLTGQYLIQQIYTLDYIIDSMIVAYNLSMAMILYFVYQYEIPEEYLLEIQGIVDATGLTYEEILMQVVWLDLYYGILQPMLIGIDSFQACTSIAIKNSKRNVVIGQNMDFGYLFAPTLSWVKYKVADKQWTFSLRMGVGSLVIGKNKKVTATQTLVQTWKIADFGIPTAIKCRIGFENSKSAEEFLAILTSSYSCAWNFIISDRRGNVIASETIPSFSINQQVAKKDFAVRTNTYITPALKVFLLNPAFSVPRQEMAEYKTSEKLADDGWVSISDLKEILSYNDGTDASIYREINPYNPLEVGTLASIVIRGRKCYFKFGSNQTEWGFIRV